MKVLFVGVYRDGTGWGNSAIHHILAMDSVGIDVVPRSISLGNTAYKEVPKRISELEEKSDKDCDTIIQCILPEYFVYDSRYRNIGLVATENRNVIFRRWVENMNLMDEVWVNNPDSKKCLLAGDLHGNPVTKPIHVHPIPMNIDVNTTRKLVLSCTPNTFKFYYSGELIQRKGLKQLLQAFHSEFRYNEPVSLIVKLTHPHLDSSTVETIFRNTSAQIKQSLQIYKDINYYRKEIVLANYMSREDLDSLHNSCDCFCIPSHGESWSIPAVEAVCHNNPVICTDSVGCSSYISDAAYIIPSEPEYQCFDDSIQSIPLTGNEIWSSIDVTKLREVMRQAYEDRELFQKKKESCQMIKQQFSYENVGKLLKATLEC